MRSTELPRLCSQQGCLCPSVGRATTFACRIRESSRHVSGGIVNPSRRIVLTTSSLALVGAFMLASICLATPFSIHWTAPGDDSLIGRASLYDLRYSNLPITAANFGEATPIAGLPAPAVAGTRESLLVSGLADGVAYYLAIKSVDEAGNWSPISNLMTRPGQTTDVALSSSFSSPW